MIVNADILSSLRRQSDRARREAETRYRTLVEQLR